MAVVAAQPRGRWRYLLIAPATALVLSVIGYFPTRWLGGAIGVKSMLVAQVVVLAVILWTLVLAMRRMSNKIQPERFRTVLRTMVMRFIATLSVALLVVWRDLVETRAFLIWIAIAYVVMIKVETLVLLGWNRRIDAVR